MTLSGGITIGQSCAYTQQDTPGPIGFGIDKLKIRTSDFELDTVKPWGERPNPARKPGESEAPAPVFLMNVAGRDIYAPGLYYNGETFNADIQRTGSGLDLFIKLNPSKIYGKLTTDPNVINDIFTSVQRELKEVARLDFALPDCFVSRVDLAADAYMQHPVNSYAELIRGSKARPNAGTEYPSGYLFGSAETSQSCIYDKGLKNTLDAMKAAGIKGHPHNTHLMRNEARIMNAKYVRRRASFETFSDLLETPDADLHWTYRRVTETHLKLMQPRIVFPSVEHTQLQRVLIDCLIKSPKNAMRDFLNVLYAENPDASGIDFTTLITDAYNDRARINGTALPHRSTINRAIKNFQKFRDDASARRAIFQKDAQDLHVAKLRELRAAFIEPYLSAS